MAGVGHGEPSHHAIHESGSSRHSQERPEEMGRWYFSRSEIEEISASRMDGIDTKKETYLRKSYCTFLQDLGIKLKVPQVTIASAIIFCHRFFLRQSHAKNDRRTIATVCMFLAGKVEETPRPLKDVILISYEIMHKKDPVAAQRIKQKEVYEQQKELILLGERVVLATLGFDLNVQHPYKFLVESIKKFNVAKNTLAQVAWNFVNDGLRTSLCLQFRPHHIAAGAIFLAAKFLKVKLPTDGDRFWWQEFDVTPRQLEEVSNQMLELYEQNRVPTQASEGEGTAGSGTAQRSTAKALAAGGEQGSKPFSSHAAPDHSSKDNHGLVARDAQTQNNYTGSGEMVSVNGTGVTDLKVEAEMKDDNQHTEHMSVRENLREDSNKGTPGVEPTGEHKERSGRNENAESGDCKDDGVSRSGNLVGRNVETQDGLVVQSPKESGLRIDKLKDKIAQRRKERSESIKKKDVMDEDDLIERELEHGVELAVENEKSKREHGQSWSKTEALDHGRAHGEIREESRASVKGQTSNGRGGGDAAEEGEMLEDVSPMVNSRKRKGGSSPDRHMEGKKYHEYMPSYNHNNVEDGHRMGRGNHGEKEHRRHAHDNHL